MPDALRILSGSVRGFCARGDSMLSGIFRLRLFFSVTALAALCFSPTASAQQAVLDLDGHSVNPLAEHSGKAVVLVFLRRDCPVSGRYAPVIQKISKQYAGGVNFWIVDPDKRDSAQDVRSYLADYSYHLPALRDPDHALVQLSHVQITPEVAVFDRNHRLVYDGRIDNWYVDLTSARPAPTTHELEDALHAVSAGKSVAPREVRGVGCYISDLE